MLGAFQGAGGNNCLCILLLLMLCGGCGQGTGFDIGSILPLLLIMCCCGGGFNTGGTCCR